VDLMMLIFYFFKFMAEPKKRRTDSILSRCTAARRVKTGKRLATTNGLLNEANIIASQDL